MNAQFGLALQLLDDAFMLFDQHEIRPKGWIQRYGILRAHIGDEAHMAAIREGDVATKCGWNSQTLPPASQ